MKLKILFHIITKDIIGTYIPQKYQIVLLSILFRVWCTIIKTSSLAQDLTIKAFIHTWTTRFSQFWNASCKYQVKVALGRNTWLCLMLATVIFPVEVWCKHRRKWRFPKHANKHRFHDKSRYLSNQVQYPMGCPVGCPMVHPMDLHTSGCNLEGR